VGEGSLAFVGAVIYSVFRPTNLTLHKM
jgi:hypothetical protein